MGSLAYAKAAGVMPRYTLYPTTGVNMEIPNGVNSFLVSGTTVSITGLTAGLRPGRVIWLTGAAGSSGLILTDTAMASSSDGTMSTNGTLTLAPYMTIAFRQNSDGAWIQTSGYALG